MSKAAIFVRYYLPALIWASVIFYFSSLPSARVTQFSLGFDDLILHFAEYALLGFLLGLAFLHPSERHRWQWVVLACLVGILYGASDEIHQSFVPGRHATVSDFLADSIGTITGTALYVWWRSRQQRLASAGRTMYHSLVMHFERKNR